jgi:hypothetical protein
MPESLLDECYESILKIAETQPPDGKRAILAMAKMFQVNSGRASSDGQPSSSRNLHAPDRQSILSGRLRSPWPYREAA